MHPTHFQAAKVLVNRQGKKAQSPTQEAGLHELSWAFYPQFFAYLSFATALASDLISSEPPVNRGITPPGTSMTTCNARKDYWVVVFGRKKVRIERYQKSKHWQCLLILAAVFPNSMYGQSSGGEIRGTITDPSGAVVKGAEITIEGTATRETAGW